MLKLSFLLSFFVFLSFPLQASYKDFQFLPSSSVPNLNSPLMANPNFIIGETQVLMRVKIFPHTLKNDGRHGVPDNKRELELKSSKSFVFKVQGKNYHTRRISITSTAKGMKVLFNKKALYTNLITVKATDSTPVTLYRINNKTKSHSYEGKIEIKHTASGIVAINELPIEKYLRGVVPSESPHSWPLESLKAQAVAARSYAYYHYLMAPSSRSYHVDDTARYQVYAGLSGARSSTDMAIKQTEREYLEYNNKVIVAFFHSYSGGTTDSAKNIFKTRSAPYCEGNQEIFSREDLKKELNPRAHWIVNWQTKDMSSADIIKKLKNNSATKKQFSRYSYHEPIEILEESLNPISGTVQTLNIQQNKKSRIIDFTILRKVIGWSKFPAYHYRVHSKQNNGSFYFTGYGWGHHVGMSQWGAFMMAKHHNSSYREILNHYYSNVNISKI